MSTTVADYLKTRLEQLELGSMFGVAGNYTAAFLDTILADPNSPLKIRGNANEICAGFAADAYARYNGIGAVYVTYSVGAFTMLNTIAGSYVEQVPVLMINGGPTNKEASLEGNAGLLYSHTTGNQYVDIEVFRPITAAAEKVTNSTQAPFQIDSVLTALLNEKRPVYLEVAEDVWRAECNAPVGELARHVPGGVTVSEAKDAVQATLELIKGKSKAVFWAGIELDRYQLQDQFVELMNTLNEKHTTEPVKFVTSALGKSVIAEDNPYFEGCVTMKNEKIDELLGDDGILIGLGAWTIGKDTGNENIRSSNAVLAFHNGVLVGAKFFPSVELSAYMEELQEALTEASSMELSCLPLTDLSLPQPAKLLASKNSPSEQLGYDSFYGTLEGWLDEDKMVVVDAGFPLIGAQGMKVATQGSFLSQAAWLAIGYSVPAGTGMKVANPSKRVATVVGDGAFHETCQAIADQAAYGQNNVVFVLSNGVYGIEQYIVNPNPYRLPQNKSEYPDQNLNEIFAYNRLPRWDFIALAQGFGSNGLKVGTVEELQTALDTIDNHPESHFLVEVLIPDHDIPAGLRPETKSSVGEDEYQNPNWPPATKF